MKKVMVLLLSIIAVAVIAGNNMTIYMADGNLEIAATSIDSVKFKDIISEVSALARMKLIPAKDSVFQMGAWNGDEYSNDIPVHMVSFTHDYYMDSTEVTQKQYRSLMSDEVYGYKNYRRIYWSTTYGINDDNPAYYINWYDAVLYCNALSKATGKDSVYSYTEVIGKLGNDCELTDINVDYSKTGFRLPTEAEWEYACKAGTSTNYYWGKDNNPYPVTIEDSIEIDSYAVWYNNSKKLGIKSHEYGVHKVATTHPNAFGLYDMIGNVWEWCSDQYSDYPSDSDTSVDYIGISDDYVRTLKGGSWDDGAYGLRSSHRCGPEPNFEAGCFGFRTILPVKIP